MGLLLAISGLLGLGTTLCVIPQLLRLCSKSRVVERLMECHHTHKEPVPRWGGLALVLAFAVVEAFIALFAPEQRACTPDRNVVLAGALAMFGLGLWDDIRPLGAKRKLLGQIVIAAVVCWCGIVIEFCSVSFGAGSFPLGRWGIP